MGDRLAGKVALVTGAASGLGKAQAERFVAEGARVVVTDIDEKAGRGLVAELGDAAMFTWLDVSDPNAWAPVVAEVRACWSGIDILVNNAGVAAAGAIDEFPLDQHQNMIDVNINGVYYGIRAVAETMRQQRSGSIVNISSIDGLIGVAGLSSYTTTKAAVTGLTRSAAMELGPAGIRVNSVHPGIIDTPHIPRGAHDHVQKLVDWQPIARMGRPEEVAALVLFLASEEASYITGAQMVIDGGHLAGPWRPSSAAAHRESIPGPQ